MRVLRGELPDMRADPLVAPAHRRAPRDRPAESLRRESAPRAGARTRLPLPRGADLRRGRALLDELSRGNQYRGTDPRPARPEGAARECGTCRRGVCGPPFRRAEKHPAPRADAGRHGAPGSRHPDDDRCREGAACAGASPMAAFDAAGLPDARNAAHGVRAGTGQGGLFPELHQSDDGSRPRNSGRGAAGRKDGRTAPQGGLRGGLSREHGTSLLRHDLGEQGHGRHRRPQDRRVGRGAGRCCATRAPACTACARRSAA